MHLARASTGAGPRVGTGPRLDWGGESGNATGTEPRDGPRPLSGQCRVAARDPASAGRWVLFDRYLGSNFLVIQPGVEGYLEPRVPTVPCSRKNL